jgi:precorrin-6B methylase 2
MTFSRERRSFLLGAAGIVVFPPVAYARGQDLDVPYVPTPPEVVEAMLDIAQVQPGEYVIDLGSGDGRIAIAAARRRARALGVERDARLVTRSRTLAKMAGQEERARFVRADLFTVSLRDADVVTLYLLPDVNERLRPKLLAELRPGARVVSHAFDMGEWAADATHTISDKNVYCWTIPAIAGGNWRLTREDGTSALLVIEQRYNQVAGTLNQVAITDARLDGAMLSFVAKETLYRGVVAERSITSDSAFRPAWSAERVE